MFNIISLLKKTPHLFLLFYGINSFAIGDGPRFEQSDLFLLLFLFVLLIVVVSFIVIYLYKKRVLLKAIVILSSFVVIYALFNMIKLAHYELTWEDKEREYYYSRFCLEKEPYPTRNFNKFIQLYVNEDFSLKNEKYLEETKECILRAKSSDNYYEMKTMINLMIDNDLEATLDSSYNYINSEDGKKDSSMKLIYYSFTKDSCMKKNIVNHKSEVCEKKPLNKSFALENLDEIKNCIYKRGICYKIKKF